MICFYNICICCAFISSVSVIFSDTLMRYQFNKGRISISLPLLLGGKSSAELNFPTTITLPRIRIPHIGLEIPPKNYKIPSFTIPRSLDFTLPKIGLAEVSAKMNSNFYEWEGSITGGNNTLDVPSYIAGYKMMASCPVKCLSYSVEGILNLVVTCYIIHCHVLQIKHKESKCKLT